MMRVIMILAVIVGVYLTVTSPRPKQLGDAPQVETKHAWHVLGGADDADARVLIPAADRAHELLLRDGALYDPDREHPLGVIVTADHNLIEPGWDVGAWSGYCANPLDSHAPNRFQAGLRWSPLRLGYGVFAAPDVVVSHGVGGIGASLYPPPELFGRRWRHVGIGAWYVIPWNGDGAPGLALGVAFSTRD